jgi:DNA mismatch repair protein MutS
VIKRATEVLSGLENHEDGSSRNTLSKPAKEETPQLSFFDNKPEVVQELEELEIDTLSPLEALTRLYELQKKAREG